MGVLAEVMRYKERKDAESAQVANAIPQAVAAFISGRQQQVENQQKNMLLQIQAGQAGYQIGQDGQLKLDPNSMAAQKNALAVKTAESGIARNETAMALDETKKSALEQKMANPSVSLPASRQNQKDKRTADLFSTFETNQVRKQQVADIEAVLPSIPKGLAGKKASEFMANLAPDSPILAGWQNLKNWLADEQLMYTAKTKGAISDAEMKFFANAVGNDDLTSIPRLQPIIKKFYAAIEADENAKVKAFKQMYNEDPSSWEELKPLMSKKSSESNAIPDGTFGKAKDGTPVVRKGGKWLPQ